MTYTEHQQAEFARQMTMKWRRVNVVTLPFTSVIILDTVILLAALARAPFPLLFMKFCVVSLVAAGFGLAIMNVILMLFYWRCPACGDGMSNHSLQDQPNNVNMRYRWPQYCDCGARLR